jgi:hypothetical protein
MAHLSQMADERDWRPTAGSLTIWLQKTGYGDLAATAGLSPSTKAALNFSAARFSTIAGIPFASGDCGKMTGRGVREFFQN